MKTMTKTLAGAAAAALMTVGAAAPAEAQYRYDRHYDRDRGIDAGDVIAGVAILGGIAAIAAAIGDDDDRRYDRRYGYDYGRQGYENAVNSCGYEARRYARRGQVRITDVDRVRGNRYRVRGVIEDRGYGYGYGRYDRYDRYDRRGYDRDRFTCYAYGNGRIQDFDVRG